MSGKPGRSGAPLGSRNALGNPSKGKPWAEAIKAALALRDKDEKDATLRAIAMNVIELALQREPWAVQEIANRLDGKPDVHVNAEVSILDQLGEQDRVVALGILEALTASEGATDGGTAATH